MGSQGLRAVIAAIALAAPLAIAGPGAALIGGTPGSPAQGLAQLEAGGARVCAATIITPGWALTAGHCLDESPQALRLIADPTRALSLGAAIPGPPGTDLALIEVPDTARPGAPVTATRSFSPSCSMQQRDVTIAGAAHMPGSGLTRTASSAGAWLYDECSPDLYDAMLVIGPDRPSVSICAGDSGSPVLGPDGTVHAVLVAAVAGPGRCMRSVPRRHRLRRDAQHRRAPGVASARYRDAAPAPPPHGRGGTGIQGQSVAGSRPSQGSAPSGIGGICAEEQRPRMGAHACGLHGPHTGAPPPCGRLPHTAGVPRWITPHRPGAHSPVERQEPRSAGTRHGRDHRHVVRHAGRLRFTCDAGSLS